MCKNLNVFKQLNNEFNSNLGVNNELTAKLFAEMTYK